MEKANKEEYLKLLKEREKASRVYHSHQSIGLVLADILEDRSHKSLYIKLAKNHNAETLIILAKDIAARKSILKKGAYFMTMLQKNLEDKKINAAKNLDDWK